MSISINYSITEAKIDKALKQLPYQQTKQQFVMTAIDQYIDFLKQKKQIK